MADFTSPNLLEMEGIIDTFRLTNGLPRAQGQVERQPSISAEMIELTFHRES